MALAGIIHIQYIPFITRAHMPLPLTVGTDMVTPAIERLALVYVLSFHCDILWTYGVEGSLGCLEPVSQVK